jgi:inhibitor of KinA sporulation pathway (predicted exonuclease)
MAEKVVFFDLEFTASEGSLVRKWLAPGEFKEVVQIGAVKADAASLDPLGELEILVRPRINRLLSPYLENLTGITDAAITERGIDFREASLQFLDFAEGAPIAAFGRDDLVFEENLRLYGIRDLPPIPQYLNVIPWLAENGIDMRGLHACDVARSCGAEFSGHDHDALDDARAVWIGVRTLIARGARNPFVDR